MLLFIKERKKQRLTDKNGGDEKACELKNDSEMKNSAMNHQVM